jgi:hypothetical protein
MSLNNESAPPLVNTSKILSSSVLLHVRNGVLDEVAADNQDAGRVGAAVIAYADTQVPARLPAAIERAEAQKLYQNAKKTAKAPPPPPPKKKSSR